MLELIAEALDARFTTRAHREPRRRRRRRERALAAGREVRFRGGVIGPEPYGRRLANVLFASRVTLASAYAPAKKRTRRTLPVERLRLVTVRPRLSSEKKIPGHFHVVVCRDGDTEVLIVCAPWNTGFVTAPLAAG
ncbi:hypothetical protein [Streptomyces specialis]|uniref:hypothetical protein n=1 Tax=Streptomyces specialis TaxID=498367 RepID=UPI00073F43FE|nr:hypothetical protein [Streptomyces specialis]